MSFVDTVSAEEDAVLRQLFARAIYTAGLPFDAIEGDDFDALFCTPATRLEAPRPPGAHWCLPFKTCQPPPWLPPPCR